MPANFFLGAILSGYCLGKNPTPDASILPLTTTQQHRNSVWENKFCIDERTEQRKLLDTRGNQRHVTHHEAVAFCAVSHTP